MAFIDPTASFLVWLIFGAAALWLVIREIPYRLRLRRRGSWPEAQASVQAHSVTELQPRRSSDADRTYDTRFRFRSLFGYSFQVAGERYAGHFAFITDNLPQANALQRELEGRVVPVRYDPRNPAESILASPATITTNGLEATQDPLWLAELEPLEFLHIPRPSK